MSIVSSVLPYPSTFLSHARITSFMDSIFAIGFGLGLRFVIDAVSHHDFKLTGTLVGLWEGVITLHFVKKMPSSFDPYVAYGVRMFVDLLVTESFARMILVVIWTGLGMVFADIAPDLWMDVGLNRVWRRLRRDLYILYRMIPKVAFFPKARTVRFSPSREPSIIDDDQTIAIELTSAMEQLPSLSEAIPTTQASDKRRVPGYFSGGFSETDTEVGSVLGRRPETISEFSTIPGTARYRGSIYPQQLELDETASTVSTNDLDEENLSSSGSSTGSSDTVEQDSIIDPSLMNAPEIPDVEEAPIEEVAAVPLKDLDVEFTPKQRPAYLPPTPSDSAARFDFTREDVPHTGALEQIPDFLDDDWDHVNKDDTEEKPPTPPAKDDLPASYLKKRQEASSSTNSLGLGGSAGLAPPAEVDGIDDDWNNIWKTEIHAGSTSALQPVGSSVPPSGNLIDNPPEYDDMYLDEETSKLRSDEYFKNHARATNDTRNELIDILTNTGNDTRRSGPPQQDFAKIAQTEEQTREEDERKRREEDDAARRKTEEEAAHQKAEEEKRRKKEEKLKEADERKRRAEEEKQRQGEIIKKKQEEKRQQEAEELEQKAKALKAAEERRQKEEDERKLKEVEEMKRKVEYERKRREEEEEKTRIAALAEQEEARLAALALAKQEEENRQKEEAMLAADEQDKKRREEEARLVVEEQDKKRREEEARLAAEEQDKKLEEEARQAAMAVEAEEPRRKQEQEQETRIKAEEEAKIQREKEAQERAGEGGIKEQERIAGDERQQQERERLANAEASTSGQQETSEPKAHEVQGNRYMSETQEHQADAVPPTKEDNNEDLVQVSRDLSGHEDDVDASPVDDDTAESIVTVSEAANDMATHLHKTLLLRAQVLQLETHLRELQTQAASDLDTDLQEGIQHTEKTLRKYAKKIQQKYDQVSSITSYFNEPPAEIQFLRMTTREAEERIREAIALHLSPSKKSFEFKATLPPGGGAPAKRMKQVVVSLLTETYIIEPAYDPNNGRVFTVDIPEEDFDEWVMEYRLRSTRSDDDE